MQTSEPALSTVQLIGRLNSQEEAAFSEICGRYSPRMLAIARQTTSNVARTEPEDVVQSALVSFWNLVVKGGLDPESTSRGLMNLLSRITKMKALKRIAALKAQKRGNDKVVNESQIGGHTRAETIRLDNLIGELPAQEYDAICAEILESLDDELRDVVTLRLGGFSNSNIAEKLGLSERGVEDRFRRCRNRLTEIFGNE